MVNNRDALHGAVPVAADGHDGFEAAFAEDLEAVEGVLAEFLVEQEALSPGPEVTELVGWVRGALAGGKKLRPLLCCFGWRAGGGRGRLPEAVARVASSFEMFHTFAVLHDDVMDDAPTRRGRPATQHLVAARHADHPDAGRLGTSTAILLGDIALGWSYELVGEAELDEATRKRVGRALSLMRTQTVTGQYLDVYGVQGVSAERVGDVGHALRIARGKTAGYTAAWPLHVGAVLASAGDTVVDALTEYGFAIGEAFQLRDDLLNVFGRPAATGKPSGDDLVHGKHTALLAFAWRDADPDRRAALARLMSRHTLDEEALQEAREILTATGARSRVEDLITAGYEQACEAVALAALPPDITLALTGLAHGALVRER